MIWRGIGIWFFIHTLHMTRHVHEISRLALSSNMSTQQVVHKFIAVQVCRRRTVSVASDTLTSIGNRDDSKQRFCPLNMTYRTVRLLHRYTESSYFNFPDFSLSTSANNQVVAGITQFSKWAGGWEAGLEKRPKAGEIVWRQPSTSYAQPDDRRFCHWRASKPVAERGHDSLPWTREQVQSGATWLSLEIKLFLIWNSSCTAGAWWWIPYWCYCMSLLSELKKLNHDACRNRHHWSDSLSSNSWK